MSAWQAEFKSRFAKLGRRYFQYERLQEYREPDNPSYAAFSQGDHVLARQRIVEFAASQSPFMLTLCRRDVPYVRVHAVQRPLTAYLRWELEVYQALARYGQRILIVEIADRSPRQVLESYDFLLFDRDAVMVQDYGYDGTLSGGWITSDQAIVAQFSDLAAALVLASVPLGEFEGTLTDKP